MKNKTLLLEPRIIFALVILLLLFPILACNALNGSPPKDFKNKAIEEATSNCGKNFLDHKIECRDAKIVYTKKQPLTDADKANGVAEEWCIEVRYLQRLSPSSEWTEEIEDLMILRKKGNLEFYRYPSRK